ncbi:aminopyrimidine aminohydrolase-like [Hoplias malabaricus]|uniref:aminopyrimidine aminohydrolase-like n=1 Tax=Hoplias malabaricus TaxID=27720 RepID=UPI003462F64B
MVKPNKYMLKEKTNYGLASKNMLDVYEFLWENNQMIANQTLRVDFLVQMKYGSLQAERYVNFTLQDINYLLEVTKMLKEMSEKVKMPDDIRAFMIERYNSYKNFQNQLLSQYFLKGAPPIQPTPAMFKYLSDYRKVIKMEKEPIYFVVALLPCSRLWLWLANNLDITQSNAYYTWKKNNMVGHPEKHYKVILNNNLNTTDKIQMANAIFRMQMENEHDFFATS